MPDLTSFMSLLEAGGAVVGTAMVEEATKDAWQATKAKLKDVFGRRAETGAEKLESPATREEGRQELARAIPDLTADEADDLQQTVERLVAALQADRSAAATMAENRINLDLSMGGNILLSGIRGAQGINVRAQADGDFTLTDVDMASGGTRGN
jgi:hypothetical protein